MPPRPAAAKPSKQLSEAERRKTAPKKAVSPGDRIKRLFNTLQAQIDGGHFKNAVKTCDKILRIEPKDKDAIQTKLFLVLQTSQYDAALQLLATTDNENYAFEKAYSLYRQNKESEVSASVSDLRTEMGEDDPQYRGVLHLEAQLSYRQGHYQTSLDLYTQLLDTCAEDSEEHADLLTNLNATQTHLEFMNAGFLHALDALPTSITNSLETAPPPVPPTASTSVLTATTAANQISAGGKDLAMPEKKVRKSRVPKGVIPGVTPPPDPERWLKRSERSNFGQGPGRRRRAAGGGATQGSMAESAPVSGNTKASTGKAKKRN